MLLMHCLPAHPEHLGDVLPGPPLAAGIGDLCALQGLGQTTQRRGGLQPHSRVSATGCRCQVSCFAHASSLVDTASLSRTRRDSPKVLAKWGACLTGEVLAKPGSCLGCCSVLGGWVNGCRWRRVM